VSIPSLIDKKRSLAKRVLTRTVTNLETLEMEHRSLFENEKLSEILPETAIYYCSKVIERVRHPHSANSHFGKANLDHLADKVRLVREALAKRGELVEEWEHDMEEVEYPIGEVQAYFAGTGMLFPCCKYLRHLPL
jgi:hypothetical protein